MPVNIYLDKLFKSPEADAPSDAHIRVIVHIDEEYEVPQAQAVVIQLHTTNDFAFHPAYEFEIPSEALLVEGNKGRAEYVSGDLDINDYYVFVFLDLSGNGYHDVGEPSAVFKREGEPSTVHVQNDRTDSIELTLEVGE